MKHGPPSQASAEARARAGRTARALGLVAVLLGMAGAALARVPELAEGPFEPVLLEVVEDGVPVRAEPGFVYREVNHLGRGQQVLVDERSGDWVHVRTEGWVLLEHLARVKGRSTGKPSRRMVVLAEGSRVRGGPGTSHPVQRKLSKGATVDVIGEENGWVQLADGGWLHGDLVQPPTGSSGGSSGATELDPFEGADDLAGRWSLMDLNGVMFEVAALDPKSKFLQALKREMKRTGMLEEDWTYLRLTIGVPDGPYRFNYSPDKNVTQVIAKGGETYGNVYLKGPTDRLPAHVRGFFEPRTVHPGEIFQGVLLFRPTLEAAQIAEMRMFIGGRLQRLWPSP